MDPNAPSQADAGIFGLNPKDTKDCKLVLIPVPWDVTTSYLPGTAKGPQAILRASHQKDLADEELVRPYEPGIEMLDIPKKLAALSNATRAKRASRKIVNKACDSMNAWVQAQTRALLEKSKLVGVVGGDHSSPLGAIQAVAEKEKAFGILHLDAHHDLRKSYEGYTFSHASIFYNVCESVPNLSKLVQVGIRDFCEEEQSYAEDRDIKVFYDGALAREKMSGTPWAKIAADIVRELPERVWVSFDIDALDPALCPGTGTPVPGGLNFYEAQFLISDVVSSGRKIIGFDLCEVGPSEWDANVGMRVLYQLCGWTLASHGLVRRR